ncbi:hypothetical protein BCR33DRAFT_720678 [Rhizoclosmatium globosum]|uniref:Uncharacterized protein n=1 Tax=Rhizoclosmatium globosum TaxID=329046 RepID=A0A1Y2BV82_9FUNG|nr:hypothetical protein BCR33DRAFT_720678 [Rhizoclosmatium globosum]|eukprot:ORY38682.1 hypothetical protein BCR33DRAFT_720678 [Rhizoclosmatium globosum]
MNVDVPKLLIEQLVGENLTNGDNAEAVSMIPSDTMDHLVALGFKLYGEDLIVSVGLVQGDASSFEQSIEKRDVEALKEVVYGHCFTPVLVPVAHPFWKSFWKWAVIAHELDAQIGSFLIKHAGVSATEAVDKLVSSTLYDPSSTPVTFEILQKYGYAISEKCAVSLLKECTPSNNSTEVPAPIQLLQQVLPTETLAKYVESALHSLFRTIPTDTNPAHQQIDLLLRAFKSILSEQALANAILASPPSANSKDQRTLPFMTACGQTHGGVLNSMWQVACAEFGPNHPFLAAFLVDVVIGGTISFKTASVPTQPIKQEDSIVVVAPDGVIRRKSLAVSALPMRRGTVGATPSSPIGLRGRSRTLDSRFASLFAEPVSESGNGSEFVNNGEYDNSDDRDRDVAARETIQAMVEGVLVPFDAGMLIPLCRAILILKSVRSRVLDFMARAEKEILRAAYLITASPETPHLSKTKWISALHNTVIDSQAWLEHVMTTSELTVLEGLKPASPTDTVKPKRRTGVHPPVPGIFSSPVFSVLLQSAGDASVVEMDAGPLPASVREVARAVRMRRQKSVSAGMVVPSNRNSGGANPIDLADVKRFYKSVQELVSLLEGATRGAVVDDSMTVGPFQKWLEEKNESVQVWNGWLSRSKWF